MGEMVSIQSQQALSADQLALVGNVLNDIEKCGSLRKACELNAVGTTNVLRWIETDQALTERYARARHIGYDNLAETALYEATEATDVSKAGLLRIAFDARKWYLSKLASDKYGDKVKTEHSGAVEIQTTRDPLVSELAALLRQAKRPEPITIEQKAESRPAGLKPALTAKRVEDISDLI